MPSIFVDAPRELLLNLTDARITLVMANETLVPKQRCNGGPDKTTTFGCDVDPNVFHHIDAVFNANGNAGNGQRVAIYEDAGSAPPAPEECGLDTTHEAFYWITGIHYSNPTYNPVVGCKNYHGTAVASVISGTSNYRPCGASAVEFYYPNVGIDTSFYDSINNVFVPARTSICRAEPTAAAYDWMASIGNAADPLKDPPIAAVNESWGCMHERINCNYGQALQWEGVTQDYYSRYYDMVVVKAAGNNNCDFEDPYNPHQEACPFTVNSICVGSVDSNLQMSCHSSDGNPGTDPQNVSFSQIDREEPDVVAYGGVGPTCAPPQLVEGACAADADPLYGGGPTKWRSWAGTSLAAPVITSIITLLRNQCEGKIGERYSEIFLRALMRTEAWGADPDGAAYSTPEMATRLQGRWRIPSCRSLCGLPRANRCQHTLGRRGPDAARGRTLHGRLDITRRNAELQRSTELRQSARSRLPAKVHVWYVRAPAWHEDSGHGVMGRLRRQSHRRRAWHGGSGLRPVSLLAGRWRLRVGLTVRL